MLSSVNVLAATEIAGYVGAGLAGAAYVPQISHLIRARCSAGISRLAFGVWFLASSLVTARAIALQAGVFIVLGVIQIAATAIISFYATRYRGMYCPNHPPTTSDRGGHISGPQKTESKSGTCVAPGAMHGFVPSRPVMTDQKIYPPNGPGCLHL